MGESSRRGDIDTIDTDHCPFQSFEKDWGKDDFTKIPNGSITNEKMHSDCDHTIWEGVTLHGYPVRTYSRGRLVYIDGRFTGERGWGKLIRCSLA